MQEEVETTPDNEKISQQTVCQMECKKSSNSLDFEKITNYIINSKPRMLFLLICILFVFPYVLGKITMWMYGDNSTISGMHVSTSTNLLIAAVTFLYVLLTGALVTTSKETIEQSIEAIEQSKRAIEKSEEAIKQSKKEQQIRDIEKRLELFYVPAENIMKVADEYMKNPHDTVNFLKMDDYKPRGYENQSMSDEERAVISTVEKLKKIEQYRFLATKETCGLFTKYLYEEENNENRIALSESIEKDVKEYVKRLYELKQEKAI